MVRMPVLPDRSFVREKVSDVLSEQFQSILDKCTTVCMEQLKAQNVAAQTTIEDLTAQAAKRELEMQLMKEEHAKALASLKAPPKEPPKPVATAPVRSKPETVREKLVEHTQVLAATAPKPAPATPTKAMPTKAAKETSPLPENWEKFHSPVFDVPYYVNKDTGVLVWDTEKILNEENQQDLEKALEDKVTEEPPPAKVEAKQDTDYSASNYSPKEWVDYLADINGLEGWTRAQWLKYFGSSEGKAWMREQVELEKADLAKQKGYTATAPKKVAAAPPQEAKPAQVMKGKDENFAELRSKSALMDSEQISDANRTWIVIGGLESGGIKVRNGESIKSAELKIRLQVGTRLEEIEKKGNRVHYHRLSGDGPDFGWVSITQNDKMMLELEADPSAN